MKKELFNPLSIKSILVIGSNGELSRLTMKILSKEYPKATIIGIDSREIKNQLYLPKIYQKRVRYNKGTFERLFRNSSFDLVFLIGRILHAENAPIEKMSQMLDIKLMEMKRLLELCEKFKVKKMIVLGTHHIYGASPHNCIFIDEEEKERAKYGHPRLLNALETDNECLKWQKKYSQLSVVLLRPCHIIGKNLKNTMSRYLKSYFKISPIDYNPMLQFIETTDMASTLFMASLYLPEGVYNVAPDDFISLKKALTICPGKKVPSPSFALTSISKNFKILNDLYPDYLLDHLKFSCLLDNNKIKKLLGENFLKLDSLEAVESLK